MFAVVDIETTGGRPHDSSITEVCVVITDGRKVEKVFETLLNPGVSVPRNITALTGISDSMLQNAPSFASVATELHHLLHDKIFVAHNVNFDYSFLKAAFGTVNLSFAPSKLCTVKLSRKAFPGKRSYGLGNICASLGIQINDRHRAGGDALATAELLHLCAEELGLEQLRKMAGGSRHKLLLPPGIDPADIMKLPTRPGVYFFKDHVGKSLYIGKAINLQKRVLQHFDTKRGKSAIQLEQIATIDFEETGNELIALLTEAEAIQKFWPPWNVSGKTPQLQYAIVNYQTQSGEIRLQTARRPKGSRQEQDFSRLNDAKTTLGRLLREYDICNAMSRAQIKCHDDTCYCHFDALERKTIHNQRVLIALESLDAPRSQMLLVGDGRSADEKGVIHIADGAIMGWGFINEWPEYPDPSMLVSPKKDLPETRAIAAGLLRKLKNGSSPKGYTIIPLNNTINEFVETEK
jgi:DNA polymerase III subunit epsilon